MVKSLSDSNVMVVEGSPPQTVPTYLSGLKVWHGTYTDENLLKIFLKPFPFILSPVARILHHLPRMSRIDTSDRRGLSSSHTACRVCGSVRQPLHGHSCVTLMKKCRSGPVVLCYHLHLGV